MAKTIVEIVQHIRIHPCNKHGIFNHWVAADPAHEVIGALFHQIQSFCAATRPGRAFPSSLMSLGFEKETKLLQEIVDSEEGHGADLATMAGFIINRAAKCEIFHDLYDQTAVERQLKNYSDQFLGHRPCYNPKSGLTIQARKAIAVFDRRKCTDRKSTFYNLGVALALEITSNHHLIPGEKHCLVDSGLYGARLSDPQMHYLEEHWGELGAEQQHEKNAMAAVSSILTAETEPFVLEGVNDFLDSLVHLWDVLDSALLQSGYGRGARKAVITL
jgi:hypothetical protein